MKESDLHEPAAPANDPRVPPSARDFDALFDRYYRRALGLAVLAGARSEAAAEDVVGEAMARVWRAWRRGGIDDFWPYLRVAVVNELRSVGRRHALATRHRFDARTPVEPFDELVVKRALLAAALESLPSRQRLALVLRFYEDLSEADTARMMRCSIGTVKSTTARALAVLRERMKDGPA